jgi:hypothetical protein
MLHSLADVLEGTSASIFTAFPLNLDSGRQPQTYVKPEAAVTVFELLTMSGVSLETC